jgi:hypothetical protein
MGDFMIDVTQPHHYFITSAATWVSDNNLEKGLKRHAREKDGLKLVNVWFVPGDDKSEYKISYYAPQVEGAELIAVIER